MKLKYYLPEHGQDADDPYEFEFGPVFGFPGDFGWAASEAASDYHSNHDGWESSWPEKITLVTDDGEFTFIVERDYDPVFTATRLDDDDVG